MSSHEKKDVSVVCPECGTARRITIPTTSISAQDGLNSIRVPQKLVCEHSFQILVDKNFIVRGYGQADFEIGTDRAIPSRKNDISLSLLFRNFDKSTAALLYEAIFTLTPTILVGVDEEIIPDLYGLYKELFPEAQDKIILVTQADYTRLWKNRIYSSEYKDSVVIDAKKGNVVKSDIKKAKFGEVVLSNIQTEKNDSVQKVILKNWVLRIRKYMEITQKLVSKQPGIKKKGIIKHLTRLHDYNPKTVPFEIIIQRLMHIDDKMFRPYL